MNPFASFTVYLLAVVYIGRGLMALFRPQQEFALIGIMNRNRTTDLDAFAPIIMLGMRDISLGLFLMANHHIDNPTAVATLMAAMSVMKIGDALVVFFVGHDDDNIMMTRVSGHILVAAVLLIWALNVQKF
ncbi:sorbose reductase sou1 [Fusarium heterosporum]|uniref:Sorbose reductase sou1 n=1 Tax=Fusarium heterosporum TaxID=42747 RepID=A0A8H5WRC2_FUSHE|nr:sorbose reductase sou1 [Fusarium heterosporum]